LAAEQTLNPHLRPYLCPYLYPCFCLSFRVTGLTVKGCVVDSRSYGSCPFDYQLRSLRAMGHDNDRRVLPSI